MRTTIQQLAEFLTACRGNWRNACFISCGVCKCRTPCSGYLMSADAGGKPVLISIAEYERLTAQRIEPNRMPRTALPQRFRGHLCTVPQLVSLRQHKLLFTDTLSSSF